MFTRLTGPRRRNEPLTFAHHCYADDDGGGAGARGMVVCQRRLHTSIAGLLFTRAVLNAPRDIPSDDRHVPPTEKPPKLLLTALGFVTAVCQRC